YKICFPPVVNSSKPASEGFISGEYHLRDGTHDQIHNQVERELLPHGFHSCIANIIREYNSGIHISKPTRVETLWLLFNTYLGSLNNLQEANIDRLQNLLLRLHDNCIVLSGAFKDPVAEEPNNIIAIEQFDATLVERYQPRYDAAQRAVMATRANIIDDKAMEADQDENEGTDKETDRSEYGEAGPGPSTLQKHQARAMEPDEFDWEGYHDDDDGLDDHMHDM
ncbi:hypothetical protein FRC06_010049, partial [Ceratobasidium sp. 370]